MHAILAPRGPRRGPVPVLGPAHGSEHQVVTSGTIPDGFDVITSWSHPAPFGNIRTQMMHDRRGKLTSITSDHRCDITSCMTAEANQHQSHPITDVTSHPA
jgi:hypothetical protein